MLRLVPIGPDRNPYLPLTDITGVTRLFSICLVVTRVYFHLSTGIYNAARVPIESVVLHEVGGRLARRERLTDP